MSVTAPNPARSAAEPSADSSRRRPDGGPSAAFWHRVVRLASLATIAAALLVALARGHGAAVPVALFGLGLGWLLVARSYRGTERRMLTTLFLAALAVRIVAAVGVHLSVVTTFVSGSRVVPYVGVMFEDDRVFDNVSWALARTWAGVIEGVDKNDGYLINNYTYTAAWLYYLLGHELLAPKFLNCVLGALVPILTYSMGRELGGERVARLAALFAAFFPSLLLWSILNLKDVLVVFLLTGAMLATLRFARTPGLLAAGCALAAFALLENVRVYVFYLLGWLMPTTFFVLNRSAWRRRLAIGLPFAIAVLSLVYLTNQNQWLGMRYLTDKRLEALDHSRSAGAGMAESGIGFEQIPRSQGGSAIQLLNAPRVLPYVLFAPFPWAATRPRELAAVPETLGWYGIQGLVLSAIAVYGRRRWRQFFLPVAYGAGMIAIASLIEGNVGTIYRHRAMLMPPAFVLAGIGFVWLQARWRPGRPQGTA